MPRYQSSGLDTTYDRTVSNYDWDGEYVPSKQNWPLSRTPSNHLWPLACVLPVITFGIYNLQIPLPCTTNRSTWYQIHKNGRKAPFLKVSTHSLQLRENFKPFFHCLQLQLNSSYRTSAAPTFALKLWTCLLHTLNSQKGLCNETCLIIDYIHTTILNFTTFDGLLEKIPRIHCFTHVQDWLFPFHLCWHQFQTDIWNLCQKIPKTNVFDHWCLHA